MADKIYIEDIFLEFSRMVLTDISLIDHRDVSAINSFFNLTSADKALTKSQRDFMVRLLKKYALISKTQGLDYTSKIASAEWKHECRVLDMSRRAFVEKSQDKRHVVCVRFPYAFKSVYEKEFLEPLKLLYHNHWDHDRKINKIDLNKVNFVYLYDFLKQHDFEFDESVYAVLTCIEEIWAQQDSISPYCWIYDQEVVMENLADDAKTYWEKNKKNQKNHDLMLAKQMAVMLKKSDRSVDDIFEKICSSEDTAFWCYRLDDFFTVHKELQGITSIILDRSDDVIDWLENFLDAADRNHVDRTHIKVCFRDENSTDTGLNSWIKDNHVGGKVSEGKIFIFRQKPAKWLFTDGYSVKLVATNSLFPITNITTQKWLNSQYCLMYLGDIKASHIKEKNIVQL
jgi:hypothetical protein